MTPAPTYRHPRRRPLTDQQRHRDQMREPAERNLDVRGVNGVSRGRHVAD
jgi:hypothetical protein